MNASDFQQNAPSPGLAGGSERVSGRAAPTSGIPVIAGKIVPLSALAIRPHLDQQIQSLLASGFLQFEDDGIYHGSRHKRFPLRFGSRASRALTEAYTVSVSGIHRLELHCGLPEFAVISCPYCIDDFSDLGPAAAWITSEWFARPRWGDGQAVHGVCDGDHHIHLVPSPSGGWKVGCR
jgi:hypothetical protein